jgi:hypothetical protein
MTAHARYCYREKSNNNIYREKMEVNAELNPEKIESLKMEIHRNNNIPAFIEDSEVFILRQSNDYRGIFNMFEPEFKNMVGLYFDSLSKYVYNFDNRSICNWIL